MPPVGANGRHEIRSTSLFGDPGGRYRGCGARRCHRAPRSTVTPQPSEALGAKAVPVPNTTAPEIRVDADIGIAPQIVADVKKIRRVIRGAHGGQSRRGGYHATICLLHYAPMKMPCSWQLTVRI